MYYDADENDIDDYDLLDVLPQELAGLIMSASAEMPSPSTSGRRYYPSYADGGESCSTKSTEEIGSWETSYDTLRECCDASFGWDYDACMNNGNGEVNDDSDLLDMLPRELVVHHTPDMVWFGQSRRPFVDDIMIHVNQPCTFWCVIDLHAFSDVLRVATSF